MITTSARFKRGALLRLISDSSFAEYAVDHNLSDTLRDEVFSLNKSPEPFIVVGYDDSIHLLLAHPNSENQFSLPHWLFTAVKKDSSEGTPVMMRITPSDIDTEGLKKLFSGGQVIDQLTTFHFPEIAKRGIMPTQTVKFKLTDIYKESGWPEPSFSREGDAGIDLRCMAATTLMRGEKVRIPTGVHVEIPVGFVGLIFPRSGFSVTHKAYLGGGVIDSNFRGEINCIMISTSDYPFTIDAGERFAQLVIVRQGELHTAVVDELSPSVRGDAGYGSSGKV